MHHGSIIYPSAKMQFAWKSYTIFDGCIVARMMHCSQDACELVRAVISIVHCVVQNYERITHVLTPQGQGNPWSHNSINNHDMLNTTCTQIPRCLRLSILMRHYYIHTIHTIAKSFWERNRSDYKIKCIIGTQFLSEHTTQYKLYATISELCAHDIAHWISDESQRDESGAWRYLYNNRKCGECFAFYLDEWTRIMQLVRRHCARIKCLTAPYTCIYI